MLTPPPVDCLDEETVLTLLDGRLSPDAHAKVEAHLAGCRPCTVLVALAARGTENPTAALEEDVGRPALVSARGPSIGRYTILGVVGRGGMGEVYAAYDPELDRRVALKLLHEDDTHGAGRSDAQLRLLREAKAAARLSHPNTIVVHDAGTVDGRVFIAMEFVKGQNAAEWLAARPRSWPQLRDVFVAAGRGIAAAHDAGLVHRDVKPQNIMVGDDGTVRVTDFGLASDELLFGPSPPAGAGTSDSIPHRAVGRPSNLTRTDTWLGTPLYMSPEQFRGEKADRQTDQFSFCVALYEAAYGQRPFESRSIAALRAEVLAGRLREPPHRHGAPAWLRRVLWRGLSTRREDRFPTMAALLTALEQDPMRKRRRIVLGVVSASLLLGAGAVAQRFVNRPAGVICGSGRDKVTSIWDLPGGGASRSRRGATKRAFLATGKEYSATAWENVAKTLDQYVARWAQMYQDSCEATHVTGEQSTQVLDLRTDCLNSSLEGLGAVIELFSRADDDVVLGAARVAGGLPDLNRCADTRLLRAIIRPPADAAQRTRVEALRRRAAIIRALTDAGKPGQALPDAQALVDDARLVGYQPTTADALSLLGLAQYLNGEPAVGLRLLGRALPVAVDAHDDQKAAEVATLLAGLSGFDLAKTDEGDSWADLGEAFLRRVGPSGDRTRAWLAQARGNIRLAEHRFKEAEAWYREAISLKRKHLGDDNVDVALSYDTLGLAMMGTGQLQGALEANDRAIDLFRKAVGNNSPLLGQVLSNRGEIFNELGRPADALSSFQQGLAVWMPTLSSESPWLGYPLTGMGQAYLRQGKPKEAISPLQRALTIREHGDPSPERLGETRFALARALWAANQDRPRSRTLANLSRADYARQPGLSGKAKVLEIDRWLATRGPLASH